MYRLWPGPFIGASEHALYYTILNVEPLPVSDLRPELGDLSWKHARTGKGGAILLTGEAGIGKSRLTADAGTRAIAGFQAKDATSFHLGRVFTYSIRGRVSHR